MTTPILLPLPADISTVAPPAAVPPPAEKPVVVPQVEPPAKPVIEPVVDPRMQALEAELAHYRREAAKGELESKAARYRAQLESENWPPELAAVQAKTWFEKEAATAQLAEVADRQETQAKHEVARRLATHFGAPLDSLLVYPTPEAMLMAAQRLGNEAKRLTALETELTALKAGTVPAQTFDNGQGSTSATDQAFIAQYAAGNSQDHARAKKLLGM